MCPTAPARGRVGRAVASAIRRGTVRRARSRTVGTRCWRHTSTGRSPARARQRPAPPEPVLPRRPGPAGPEPGHRRSDQVPGRDLQGRQAAGAGRAGAAGTDGVGRRSAPMTPRPPGSDTWRQLHHGEGRRLAGAERRTAVQSTADALRRTGGEVSHSQAGVQHGVDGGWPGPGPVRIARPTPASAAAVAGSRAVTRASGTLSRQAARLCLFMSLPSTSYVHYHAHVGFGGTSRRLRSRRASPPTAAEVSHVMLFICPERLTTSYRPGRARQSRTATCAARGLPQARVTARRAVKRWTGCFPAAHDR